MVNEKFSLNPKVIGKRVFQRAILYLTPIKYKYTYKAVPRAQSYNTLYNQKVNVNTISKQSCSLFSSPDRIVFLHYLLILLLGSANSVRWLCCLLKSLLDLVLWRIIAHIVLPLDVLLSARLYDTLC